MLTLLSAHGSYYKHEFGSHQKNMENTFNNKHLAFATAEDVAAITSLLNSAYRGESSKQGWTTEAHLIGGNVRTTPDMVQAVLAQPGSIFIKYSNDAGELTGCVNLQIHGNKLYLGMFSVAPHLQGGGVGKILLAAAETCARQAGCTIIYMHVVSVRSELIAWYERKGYADTGERIAFNEDGIHGKHLQELEFMVMEKKVAAQN